MIILANANSCTEEHKGKGKPCPDDIAVRTRLALVPKTLLLILLILIAPALLSAQSKTTEALQKKYGEALNLFFYNNTLRMLNQAEDKGFDELIKDIEKMRFLLIKKKESAFGDDAFTNLISNYKAEAFEPVLTSRHDGKNFDVYLKENDGKTNGMLVLINDAENLYILDILGRIALDKVTELYSTLDKSSDISGRIKDFISEGDEEENQDDDDGDKELDKVH